ncbi:hypothetical protein TNCV_2765211 [Trichonephila clavipes]|nr:hypothetical protein TNCV_2765211 [Trichonephila clavipes]
MYQHIQVLVFLSECDYRSSIPSTKAQMQHVHSSQQLQNQLCTDNTIKCLDYDLYLFLPICYILLNLCAMFSTGVEQLRNLDLRKESFSPDWLRCSIILFKALHFLCWPFTASTTERIDITKRVSLASFIDNCACLSRNAGILVSLRSYSKTIGDESRNSELLLSDEDGRRLLSRYPTLQTSTPPT